MKTKAGRNKRPYNPHKASKTMASSIDVVPLKQAGWIFKPSHGISFGVWLDPVTGFYFKTEEALKTQERRE